MKRGNIAVTMLPQVNGLPYLDNLERISTTMS